MSDDKKLETFSAPTPEELKEEEEGLKEAKEDEIRKQVIADFGFDEEVDSDSIDKIVKERLEHKKALSTAIRQKIERRKQVEELQKKFDQKEEIKVEDKGKGLTPEELETRLDERERKRDLIALEVSDELRKEIESYAKIHPGMSVKQAFESEYIKFLRDKDEIKRREEEASAGGGGGTRTVKNLSKITQPRKTFDLSTKEGRDAYEKWAKNPENLKSIPLE